MVNVTGPEKPRFFKYWWSVSTENIAIENIEYTVDIVDLYEVGSKQLVQCLFC